MSDLLDVMKYRTISVGICARRKGFQSNQIDYYGSILRKTKGNLSRNTYIYIHFKMVSRRGSIQGFSKVLATSKIITNPQRLFCERHGYVMTLDDLMNGEIK
jgi:hypothetical protein